MFLGGILLLSAKLESGKIVSAIEYDPEHHGSRIYCLDKQCKAPVFFVQHKEHQVAHFKTSGKGDSRHMENCGFYKPLDFFESVNKVREYQEELLVEDGIKEQIIRLNMGKIDPDYESRPTTDREPKKKDETEVKVKKDTQTPQSIGSVKSVAKLMTSYEPDILSSILINIGSGRRIPITQLILNQTQAADKVWGDTLIHNTGYFVYGTVQKIVKREKVLYINFKEQDDTPFTLVVFEKYFPHFTYTEEELADKKILAYGFLRKNDFNNKRLTEMVIKSDSYLEKIKG